MSAADFPMHPVIAGCAAFPSGMSLCGKKVRSFPRICLLFPREVPDSYTVPVCSALPSVSSGLMIFLSVCPQACPRLFRFRSRWPAVALPLPGQSGRKKKDGGEKVFSSVSGYSRKMVRPGGVEPSTKSLEGSCSIQLSYGRTAIRLLPIDTVLRSVSRAQAGCGTAPGAVQGGREKG